MFLKKLGSKIDSIFYIPEKRIPPLDCVRACAIVLVIMRHCFDRPLSAVVGSAPVFLQYIMSFGWIGVDLFFVLSGFLIGGMIYKQVKENTFSFKRFYLNRAFRILPVAYIFLIIVYWQHFAFNRNTLFNFLFITNYFNNSFPDHYWSLNVEEHFYLIFPVLFLLAYRFFKRRALSINNLLTAIILGIGFCWFFRYYFVVLNPVKYLLPGLIHRASHWQIDYFLLGVLAAILHIEGLVTKNKWLSRALWLVPGSYFILALITARIGTHTPLENQSPVFLAYLSPFYAIFSFLFVLCAATQKNIFTKIMSLKLFKWIGLLSYSMYIWHLFVIGILGKFISQYILVVYKEHVIFSFFIVFSVVLSITTVFALFSYMFIEKPFLIARDRILGRRRDTFGIPENKIRSLKEPVRE